MSYLHVRLVEAVGLPSTDLLGFADPYCKVFLKNVTHLSENKIFKSEAKKKSTDPIFDCAASLNVSAKDFDNGLLTIDIYDRDKAKKTHDELGSASLPLSYFKENKQFQGWLPIRSSTHNKHKQKTESDNNKNNNAKYKKPKEESPELQLLNGNGDINAAPPIFPLVHIDTNTNTNNNDDMYNNDDDHNDEKEIVCSLESINSIHTKLNLQVGNISPVLPSSKQKKLGALSEDFLKKRQQDLALARSETFTATATATAADSADNKTNEYIIQQTNTIDAVVIKKYEDKDATTLPHGRRNRDSGRVFIVVHYQNQFHFGKMSNQDVKKTRIKNLKIINEFAHTIPFNVFTLTFNAGNCSLSDFNHSLSEWLPNNGSVDLYALAFQELNEKKNKKEEEEEEEDKKEEEEEEEEEEDMNQQTEIEHYLLNHINIGNNNNNNNYVSVAHYKMWQTRLFLFSKKSFSHCISNVTCHFHTTGIGGIVKNKGGVAISLEFDGISLCFLSCHLAAHQTKIKERNTMYKKLCKHIKVGWPKQPLLGQFHFIFFMGDMNYRVNYFGQPQTDKPSDEFFQQVCQIIKQITVSSSKQQITSFRNKNKNKNQMDSNKVSKQITGGGSLKIESAYNGLLKYDQLNEAIKERKAFIDFREHHIKFPPSFKVKRQIGIHYISQRLPAWCDRILWRCGKSFDENKEYKVKNYRIYDKVNISDHKPVSCSFMLPTWKRPCGISDDCTKAIVYLRNVSAKNLISSDVNGKSDPFIHFPRQLILEKYVQSKRVNKTLNPKWKNKHLKPLIMIRNSLPFLSKALLLFQIRDHDKFTTNDLIGCGYLELKYCVKNLNKWVKFREFLTLKGKDAGIFMGEIKLEYKIKSSAKK